MNSFHVQNMIRETLREENSTTNVLLQKSVCILRGWFATGSRKGSYSMILYRQSLRTHLNTFTKKHPEHRYCTNKYWIKSKVSFTNSSMHLLRLFLPGCGRMDSLQVMLANYYGTSRRKHELQNSSVDISYRGSFKRSRSLEWKILTFKTW